jgi:hypothetical protein
MHGARATTADPGIANGSWSEIFRNGLGLYSALMIGGIAMNATQMLVIADHRSRYRRGELLHLGGDALHDRAQDHIRGYLRSSQMGCHGLGGHAC